jgi:nickel-dependent lactate racemase
VTERVRGAWPAGKEGGVVMVRSGFREILCGKVQSCNSKETNLHEQFIFVVFGLLKYIFVSLIKTALKVVL